MATITTAVYLEDAARTAGEAMTINGGSLTIRTDTRWHANSPASMTGSLGAVTISATLGGSYVLDGRNVRWVAYDAGTGNVPAVGTTVTGGTSGSTGYLLGVWASLTTAPTAVGAAVPATGFLKLREVSAAFVDNDVLTGIGATTNGVDKVGWIEVVHDQSIAITVPRLGDFTVRGDWFELGTCSGAANQTVQVPTNGGGSTTYVPGVWIETGNGTGVYEFWPALVASAMSTTNLGTDARAKFVCTEASGVIRIGHNGTTTVGYVPASGAKIRIPNVIGRQCATGTRATNAAPNGTLGTRPDFTTTSAGVIDVENFMCDWYTLFAQPYSVKLNNYATFDTVNISECASALDLNNGGTGMYSLLDVYSMNLTSNFAGGGVTDWYGQRANTPGSNDHDVYIAYCIGQIFTRVHGGIVGFARSTGYAIYATQCQNLTFDDCYVKNIGMYLNTCKNVTVDGLDYCDRYVGSTNTTGTLYCLNIQNSCDTVTARDITFGLKGTISNVHPYGGIVNLLASSNIKVRECGSRGTVLSGGSANNPAYLVVDGGNNANCKFQRMYMTPTRTGAISTLNSSKGITYEHVYGDMGDTMNVASLNTVVKNSGGTNSVTGQTSVYGTHFRDAFTGDTAGRVVLAMNEPTAETVAYYTAVAGTPKFTSAGGLVLAALNDEVIIEQDYFVKGCTGLPSTAPVVTGTNVTYVSGPDWGNHDIYFQIDVNDGGGWNGTWLDLTGTNLNSFDADIDPDLGFKLKYRIVCDNASTSNLISYIRISTTSTLAAQVANMYPLDDPVDFYVTNIIDGTEVRIYKQSDLSELGGAENVGASPSGLNGVTVDADPDNAGRYRVKYSYYYASDLPVYIVVFHNNYQALRPAFTLKATGGSLQVAQNTDRQYYNP